jgi:hypothetical protein
MKPGFIQVALIGTLIGANGALASTLCAPPIAAEAPARQVLHVARDNLRPGRVLIGLDGSRVVVRRTRESESGVQPWYARVDWKKHQITPSHSPAAAVLHLDTDDKGARYLCRIEIRSYTDAYVERNAGVKKPVEVRPGDVEVIERTQLTYDAHHRLAAAIEAQHDAEHKGLKRTNTACFHYDARDRFLGASFSDAGSCAGSGPEQIQDRFVYEANGTLLRKISAEKAFSSLTASALLLIPRALPFLVRRPSQQRSM